MTTKAELQTIDKCRKIIADAPDGATHVDDSLSFWIDYGSNGLCMAVNGKFVKGFIPLNPRRLEDLQTIADQYDEIERLRGEIETLKSPSLFWLNDDTEMGFDSIEELFEYHFDADTKTGLRLEVMQAAILPNATYELTELNENGSFEVKVLNNE